MNLEPLNDFLIVEFSKPDRVSHGGVLLPEKRGKEPKDRDIRKGVVLAAGPGRRTEDGVRLPMTAKAGDTVYAVWRGSEFELEGKRLTAIKEEDICLVVK